MRTEIRYSEDVMLECHMIINLVILEEVFIGMFICTLLKNDSKGNFMKIGMSDKNFCPTNL